MLLTREKGRELKEIETIGPKYVEEVKENYRALFKIPDEKIDEVLKLLDYGRLFPDIWEGHRETEFGKKISKICKIDLRTCDKIMNTLVNIIRGMQQRKDFISKRASDLEQLGFKKPDVRRYLRIAYLLKKSKAKEGVAKVDRWDELSREVLPRLAEMEYAFDIRCGIKKGKISEFTPIVLIKFKVEGMGHSSQELVFQTNLGFLRLLVKDMTEMYRYASVLKKYTIKAEEE